MKYQIRGKEIKHIRFRGKASHVEVAGSQAGYSRLHLPSVEGANPMNRNRGGRFSALRDSFLDLYPMGSASSVVPSLEQSF